MKNVLSKDNYRSFFALRLDMVKLLKQTVA